VTKEEEKEVEEEEAPKEDDDATKVEDETEDKKKEKKKVKETKVEYELLNKQKPIWTRKPEEVTKDEYGQYWHGVTGSSTQLITHHPGVAAVRCSFSLHHG